MATVQEAESCIFWCGRISMQSRDFALSIVHDNSTDRSERNGRFAVVGLMRLSIVLALINNGNATTRGLHGGDVARSRVIQNTVGKQLQERWCPGGRYEGYVYSLLDRRHRRSLMAM